MKLVEYVPDYVLRDLPLKVGMTVTILKESIVSVQVPAMPTQHTWGRTLDKDIQVTLTNFLPGYTEVYAPHAVHNHQVVWTGDGPDGKPWYYYSTDINNVKEVRDHA
jgi:hypothetical protein